MMRFERAVRRIGALLLCALLCAAGAPALAASGRPVPTNQKLSVDGIVRTCEVYNINDSNYFTRLFHKHMGCTPRQYRERHGILQEIQS